MAYNFLVAAIKYRWLIGFSLLAIGTIGTVLYIKHLKNEVSSLKGEMQGLEDYIEEYQAEISQCNSDKVLTEKTSNAYKNDITNLRRQLNSVRESAHCIPTESSGPSGVSPNTGGKLPSGNGLRSGWLYDFAGRAEQDRLTAKGCLDFMDQLYKSRGYND